MTQTTIATGVVTLDAPTEESFDRITAIALRLLDVPAAMITLVSEGRAYHRTRAGDGGPADAGEGHAPASLCGLVIERGQPVVVHDLHSDRSTIPAGLETPAEVRAYAGHPLRARDGSVLGAVCVFTTRPRGWTATDLASLESLARIAVAEIELRMALDTAAEQAEALRAAHAVIGEQAARQEAEAGRERIATILESITDAFFGLDAEGRFSYVNGQMEVLLGRNRDALVGMSAWDVLGLSDTSDLRNALERAQNEQAAVGLETTVPHLGAWFQVHAYPSDGGVAVFLHDITERRAAVDQLRREALHDALTGLPNRIQFMQRLGRYVERSERGQYGFGVLFIDLDRFKVINDSLGHVVGDELLVQIARRLESCLRPVDMVARFGGDEFAILLHDVDTADDAIHVAERIEAALQHPLSPAGYQVYTAASIGITLSSTGYTSREDVLRDADTAMYRAKAGGVRYAVFDNTMHEHAVTRLHLESELRPAIEEGQFRLFYQPIVDLRTARLAGFEALLRWFHPRRGLLTPHEFVPLAEETGIIVPIGWWVLEEACRALVQWRTAVPGSSLRVNVNLSGRQLVQGDMVERVERMLATYDIPPESLSLEITESVLMKNPEQVADTLRELKKRGVHLCIDDFGTGYSSFTYLHRFPVDTLKVDRAFVGRLDHEPGSHEIVQAIIGLAHSLGMEAIAEGIEHPEQLAALKPLRPPYAQGYLFGRPLDPIAALRLAGEGRKFF